MEWAFATFSKGSSVLIMKTGGETACDNQTMTQLNERRKKNVPLLSWRRRIKFAGICKSSLMWNRSKMQKKKSATFGRRNGLQYFLVLNIFSICCEKVAEIFFTASVVALPARRAHTKPRENGSHTINSAKCCLPKFAFVA